MYLVLLYLPPSLHPSSFSVYFPQTSQIQFLEKASTGPCVGAIPKGPHTLHRNIIKSLIQNMRIKLSSNAALHYTVLYSTIYRYSNHHDK